MVLTFEESGLLFSNIFSFFMILFKKLIKSSKSEILWRSRETGMMSVWLMDGTSQV
jgi:hypothetical protein